MADSGGSRDVSASASHDSFEAYRHASPRYIAATFENWLHYVVRSVNATELRARPDKEPGLVDRHHSSGNRYRGRRYPHHNGGCDAVGQPYRF